MSNNLPKTPISLLREYLDAWALRDHLTDEDIANEIVAFHDAAQWQLRSKVYFDESADNNRRRSTNRARIYRWLNDSEKDTNLLSVNFLPFVLGAMPADLRLGFLNDYMRALGLCAAGADDASHGEFGITDLAVVMKEDADVHQACAVVIATPTITALRSAEKEIGEAIETQRRAGRVIRAMIQAKSSTGAVINKFLGRAAV